MPVTIDVPTLARRMRVDLPMTADDPPVPDTTSTIYLDLGDLLESYTAEVTKYANAGTPSVAMNTAVARAVGYAYDSPPAYRDTQYGRVLLNSGAVNALNQWRDATGRGTPSPDVPTDQPDAAVPESTVQTPFDAMALHDAIAAYLAENPAEKGDKGDDSTVPGPRGAASTIPGPRGLPSTVPGPRGLPSMVPGPRGPASTVAGPRGPGPTDVELASAVADYATANPSGGARTVDQIGGNVEPDGSFGNGHWLAFELQTGQTIADTDLLEFEVTQTSTNKRVGITLTGRAVNALPDTAVAPTNGSVPDGAYALRMARVFENSTTQFGHSQATVTKTTGTATTIYLTGAHSSFWRNGIVRCWRTT